MSQNTEILDSFGVELVEFSPEHLKNTLGTRLAVGGLNNLVEAIFEKGTSRTFMSKPLTTHELKKLNDTESTDLAKEAKTYQELVAQVKINENYEPLCSISDVGHEQNIPWTYSQHPYHQACGEWGGRPRIFRARSGLIPNLVNLGRLLAESNYGLHFEDSFRPVGVQEGLYQRRYDMVKKNNPEWSKEDILLEVNSKTASTPRFAAHKGGAAFDVRIIDLETDNFLDVGHAYAEGGVSVAIDSPYVTQDQWQNRQILAHASKSVGMSMYPFEDWHICAGDTTSSVQNQIGGLLLPAIYGPIRAFDEVSGDVTDTYTEEELDTPFEVMG